MCTAAVLPAWLLYYCAPFIFTDRAWLLYYHSQNVERDVHRRNTRSSTELFRCFARLSAEASDTHNLRRPSGCDHGWLDLPAHWFDGATGDEKWLVDAHMPYCRNLSDSQPKTRDWRKAQHDASVALERAEAERVVAWEATLQGRRQTTLDYGGGWVSSGDPCPCIVTEQVVTELKNALYEVAKAIQAANGSALSRAADMLRAPTRVEEYKMPSMDIYYHLSETESGRVRELLDAVTMDDDSTDASIWIAQFAAGDESEETHSLLDLVQSLNEHDGADPDDVLCGWCTTQCSECARGKPCTGYMLSCHEHPTATMLVGVDMLRQGATGTYWPTDTLRQWIKKFNLLRCVRSVAVFEALRVLKAWGDEVVTDQFAALPTTGSKQELVAAFLRQLEAEASAGVTGWNLMLDAVDGEDGASTVGGEETTVTVGMLGDADAFGFVVPVNTSTS